MIPILRVRDKDGNIVEIPAIIGPRGPKGEKGDPGVGMENITAGDVMCENGKTVEEQLAELWQGDASMAEEMNQALAALQQQTVMALEQASEAVEAEEQNLADHAGNKENPHGVTAEQVGAVPNTGGEVNGNLALLNWLQAGLWGVFSCSGNGSVIVGENCYIDYATSQLRYKHSHPSLGARGIFFRPSAGVYMFDTGNIATTADQEFAPEFIQLGSKTVLGMTDNDLNNLMDTGFYNGSAMTNAPGASWYYIINLSHHFSPATYRTQIAINFEGTEMKVRVCNAGKWFAWSDNLLRRQKIHQSTATPTAADGDDGDVWHQYV